MTVTVIRPLSPEALAAGEAHRRALRLSEPGVCLLQAPRRSTSPPPWST